MLIELYRKIWARLLGHAVQVAIMLIELYSSSREIAGLQKEPTNLIRDELWRKKEKGKRHYNTTSLKAVYTSLKFTS